MIRSSLLLKNRVNMRTRNYQKKQQQSAESNLNLNHLRQEKKKHLLWKKTLKIQFWDLSNYQRSKKKMIKIYYQIQIIVLNLWIYPVSCQLDKLIKNSSQIQTHNLRAMKYSILIKILIIQKKQIKFNQVNQKLYMKTLMRRRIIY